MNNVRTVILKLLRTYATKHSSATAGIRGKLQLAESENSELVPEEFQDDMDEFESDFMSIDKSYNQYQRELKVTKEKLKHNIVRDKYFKEIEPKFLTYTERDQIQKLHESNPDEWTPEKLSQSFPALPETIIKILKSKLTFTSADRIINYDRKVIKNWKNFKSGKLVVDPVLTNHLMKFKNRKISLASEETLTEKFIPPKMEFPKPRSTVFSNIVKEYRNKEQFTQNETQNFSQENSNENENKLTTTENESTKTSIVKNSSKRSVNDRQKENKKQEKLTLDDFLKTKLMEFYETSPEKAITFLHTYRKRIESINSENISSKISDDIKEQTSADEMYASYAPDDMTKQASSEEMNASYAPDDMTKQASAKEMNTSYALDDRTEQASAKEMNTSYALDDRTEQASAKEMNTSYALDDRTEQASAQEMNTSYALDDATKQVSAEEMNASYALDDTTKQASAEEMNASYALDDATKQVSAEEVNASYALNDATKQVSAEEMNASYALDDRTKQVSAEEMNASYALDDTTKQVSAEEMNTSYALDDTTKQVSAEEMNASYALDDTTKQASAEEMNASYALDDRTKQVSAEEMNASYALDDTTKQASAEEMNASYALDDRTKQASAEEVNVSNISDNTEKLANVQEINVLALNITPNESSFAVNNNESQSEVVVVIDAESSSLDTYVKEWKSSVETKCDYVHPIKIPRNIYKKGMTYRVQDCYYDDDGEFLYRVPGLKT